MGGGAVTVAAVAHAAGGRVRGDGRVLLTGVAYASDAVVAGDVFCCVRGARVDGHRFAPDAVAAGASAVLTEMPLDVGVPQILVEDTRAALPYVAAAVHGFPAERLQLVGVTGTDGKSTTAHMLAHVLTVLAPAATTGNLVPAGRNTPEAPDLQRRLAEFVDAGIATVVVEASSAGLLSGRLDGLRFAASIFTNLSQDHLGEVHPTMEDYFAAKRILFEPARTDIAVVNLDDPYGQRILGWRADATLGYRLGDAEDLTATPQGTSFRWRGQTIELPLAGRFNTMNALAAATAAAALGVSLADIAERLAELPQPPGRFERLSAPGRPEVIIDYAHTPAGLQNLLQTVRTLTSGNVTVVFGCGGNRDRVKRAQMGRIAAGVAERVVLTSDNPRDEDPMAIIADILTGTAAGDAIVMVEPDRREAIAAAITAASPDELVVIAGKGAESYQEAAGTLVPFDDATIAREALDARRGSGVGRVEGA